MKIIQSVSIKKFAIALLILISFIPIYTNASNGWTEQYNSGKLSWSDVAISQNGSKIVAAPYGGYLKRSTDGGLSWSSLEQSGIRNWSDVASSFDGSVLAATVSGGYIYVSIDSGVTWVEHAEMGSNNWNNITMSSDGTKIVASISNGVTYFSNNSGSTWTANTFYPGSPWNDISISADGSILVGAAFNRNIYISTDLGVNWEEKTTSGALSWRGIAISGDGTKILASASSNYLYVSSDQGDTWTQQTSAGLKSWQGVALSYDGSKMAALASLSYVYTSSSPGTWQAETSAGSRSWSNIGYSSDGSILIASLSSENLFSYGEISLPLTTLLTPSASGENTIQLNGQVSTSHTSHGFEYGLDTNYGQEVSEEGVYGFGSFSLPISSISPNTVYHYRSFATNEDGTSYGADGTFSLNFQNYIRVNTASISGIGSLSSSGDGTKVAIISSSYIKTSTDGGVTFTNRMSSGLSSWVGISSSTDGSKLVAAIGSGGPEPAYIYTSTDGGVNWTARTQAGNRYWRAVSSSDDGSKLAALVQGGNIYISLDGGETWTPRASSRNWYAVSSSSDGTKLIAAVTSGYIYTSTDSGSTWSEKTTLGSKAWTAVDISSDGSKMIASVDNEYLYLSIDGGATWQTLSQVGISKWSGVKMNADGTIITAVANGSTTGYVVSSIDGGLTWMRQTTAGTRAFVSVDSSLDGDVIYTASSNGLYKYVEPTPLVIETKTAISDSSNSVTLNGVISNTGGRLATERGFQYGTDLNYGSTVSDTGSYSDGPYSKNISITPGVTYYYRAFATNSMGTVYGLPQEINYAERHFIEQLTSGVRNWYDIASSSDGVKLVAVDFGPEYGTTGKIYASTDSGANWTERASSDTFKWYTIASSSNGEKLIAGAYPGYLYTSTDSGVTWTERTSAGSTNWTSVASSADGTKLVSTGSLGLFTSSDSGNTWTERSLNGNIANYVSSSSDGSKLVATVGNGYIYTSIDSGVTWIERTSVGIRSWKEATISDDGNTIVVIDAVQNGNVYVSYDGGATWVERSGFESGHYWHSIVSSSDGLKLLIVGTKNLNFGESDGLIYASQDGGKSFTKQEIPDTDIHFWFAVSSSDDGNSLVVGGLNTNLYTHTVKDLPVVITADPSEVTDSSATLNAVIQDLKGEYPLSKGFMIGTDTSYGDVVEINESNSDREFSIDVSTLDEETTYHYRSFATNSIGTGLGEDKVFTTEAYVDQAPTISSFIIPATSSSLQVSISSFVANDDIGVTGYMLTETSATPSASSGSWQESAPTTYQFSSEGNKTLYAWVKDASGNVSASLSGQTIINLVSSVVNLDGYWTTLGDSNFSDSNVTAQVISDIASDNTPYVMMINNHQSVSVMRFSGNTWVNVGNPGFATTGYYADFILDNNDVPYVIIVDTNKGNSASILKYNGQIWESIDEQIFTNFNVIDVKLQFDSNNVLYIAYKYQDQVSWRYKTTVKKFENSEWIDVGISNFAEVNNQFFSFIVSAQNTPFVAFKDISGYVSVMKYSGEGLTGWEYVGSESFTETTASYIKLSVDTNNIAYVSYLSADDNTLHVMKFDGTSWNYVGEENISTQYTEFPSIIIDDSNSPYVVYTEDTMPNYLKVKKYDGESWVNVGNIDIFSEFVRYNSISVDSNDIPYIFFVNCNTYEVSSMFLFTDAIIISYTGDFIESISEEGKVEGEKVINISGENFVNPGGSLTEGTHYTLTNKPQGLSSSMSVSENGKTAILSFSGKAINHSKENSINNLTVNFLDAAFTDTPALNVLNNSNTNGKITFISLNSTFTGTTKLYGSNGTGETNGTQLFELDKSSGDIIRTIGLTGHNINGMDFHPTTGVLYGNTSNGDPDGGKPKSLFTIDTVTGLATWLGTIKDEGGVSKAFADITFKSDGTLYGFANDGGDWNYGLTNLYSISTNCSEGVCLATRVSDFELNEWASGGGIAFDSNDNLYLFKTEDLGYVKLDPNSGSILESNDLLNISENDRTIVAAKFDGSNNLFIVRDDYSLIYIDLTDRELINLKANNPDMDAMTAIAFQLIERTEEPEEPEEPTQEEPERPRRRSSGTTVSSRYNNLISMGKITQAEELKKEFPSVINNESVKPLSSAPKFERLLKYGITGIDVKELQIYLNTHGYILTETGPGSLNNETTFFGMKTKDAVMKFQKANGLLADGIVGPKTRSYLR